MAPDPFKASCSAMWLTAAHSSALVVWRVPRVLLSPRAKSRIGAWGAKKSPQDLGSFTSHSATSPLGSAGANVQADQFGYNEATELREEYPQIRSRHLTRPTCCCADGEDANAIRLPVASWPLATVTHSRKRSLKSECYGTPAEKLKK
jgi:hypothetical protein